MAKSSITYCPHCGESLTISPTAVSSSRWQKYRTFQHSAQLSGSGAPGFGDWEKVTPISRLEPRDVTTALYDCGVSFGLVSLALVGPVWYFEQLPWWISPAGGLVVALWRYFGLMSVARSLLEVVETITQADINDDGQVGPPQRQVVSVEVKNESGQRWQFADLPGSPQAVQGLAVAVLAGESFSERSAVSAGLTQEDFRSLRDLFLDRGWCEWNHPTRKQQGLKLLRSGRSVLRAIAYSPLPQDDQQAQNDVLDSTQQHAARN